MKYDNLTAGYDRDGYVIVRQFLPPGDFADLVTNLERYIREVVPTLPDKHAFYVDKARPDTLKQLQHMDLDPYFRAYAQQPTWLELARALLGEDARVQAPEWFNKPPGQPAPTPPHQDNYYFNLKPPNVLTIWLALDPVYAENGCLRYVPGSHRRGIRPHGRSNVLGFSQGITDFGAEDLVREIQIHLRPGDAVVHHGETIHRAEPNCSSNQQRRAFAMVCKGVSCQRDEEAFSRYEAALKTQHQEMGLTS